MQVVTLDSNLTPLEGWQQRGQSVQAVVHRQVHKLHGGNLELLQADQCGQHPVPSYMMLASTCYSAHLPLCVNPHDLWFVVLCELAGSVRAESAKYRRLFTRAEQGKTHLTVVTADPSHMDFEQLTGLLRQHVPADVDLFLPQFSTHTAASRTACMAAFADAAQAYYTYFTFACGLPSVEIGGTAEDWDLFAARAAAVGELLLDCGMPWRQGAGGYNQKDPTVSGQYFKRVSERAAMVAAALRGGGTEFMLDFFSQRNVGSGGEKAVDGWLAEFYVNPTGKLACFNPCLAVVPYTDAGTGQAYVAAMGCLGAEPTATGALQGVYGGIMFAKHG